MSKSKRTKKEIEKILASLEKQKESLPQHSYFGDDNWAKIDAQIAVIKGEKTADDYYVDESSDEYQDGDNELWSDAQRAEDWLNGNITSKEFTEE